MKRIKIRTFDTNDHQRPKGQEVGVFLVNEDGTEENLTKQLAITSLHIEVGGRTEYVTATFKCVNVDLDVAVGVAKIREALGDEAVDGFLGEPLRERQP